MRFVYTLLITPLRRIITPRTGIFEDAFSRFMILCQVIRACARGRARVRAREGRTPNPGPDRPAASLIGGGSRKPSHPRRNAGASAPAPPIAGGQVGVLRRLSAPRRPPSPRRSLASARSLPPSPAPPARFARGRSSQQRQSPRGGQGASRGGSGRSALRASPWAPPCECRPLAPPPVLPSVWPYPPPLLAGVPSGAARRRPSRLGRAPAGPSSIGRLIASHRAA